MFLRDGCNKDIQAIRTGAVTKVLSQLLFPKKLLLSQPLFKLLDQLF